MPFWPICSMTRWPPGGETDGIRSTRIGICEHFWYADTHLPRTSSCPLARSLDAEGEKMTLPIIGEDLDGTTRFIDIL
jgi:hypothetical protein